MDLFLSWSGHRSKAVAEALSQWLSQVIQAVDPWISSDIDKGARWSPEISDKLEKSKVGIICLTQDNLSSPWILFESGALSKTKDAYVCTFLLDLSPADVGQPLGQFQHTSLEKEDFRRLVRTINRTVQNGGERFLPDQVLDSVFDIYWPKLGQDLTTIRSSTDGEVKKPRKDREILEDILESVRTQERRLAGLENVLVPIKIKNRPYDFSPSSIDLSEEEERRKQVELAYRVLLLESQKESTEVKEIVLKILKQDLLEEEKKNSVRKKIRKAPSEEKS